MEFKVGDKVKLVRKNDEGEWYEKYLGQMFTIKDIEEDWKGTFAVLEENGTLMPYLKNLELVEETYTYEDLKKAPVGTRVTLENKTIITKLSNDYFGEREKNWLGEKIIKVEEPEYKTVYECKPEILDNTEKRYLKDVIRPFRDRVNNIRKVKSYINNKSEYIIISIGNENITLPYFEENAMYKGMRLNKEYTLEELGI